MQYKATAVATFSVEESGYLDQPADRCGLKPLGSFAKAEKRDFTSHLSRGIGFGLLRGMLEHTFGHRNSCRGITQTLALNQPAGKLNAIQLRSC